MPDMTGKYPCFLDFEASSLSDDSYPIAVAWNRPDGHIERLLIRPAPGWDDWSPTSELIHGIDRHRLESNGWNVGYVADRLEEDLAGQRVFTDAPDFDSAWLKRLRKAAGQTESGFFLEHLDSVLIERLKKPSEMFWETSIRIQALKADVANLREDRHDAGSDVGWLIQLWRKVDGLPVLRNHSVGDLPDLTQTGSFKSLKGRVKNPADAKALPQMKPPGGV
jgi:hypothetical protein